LVPCFPEKLHDFVALLLQDDSGDVFHHPRAERRPELLRQIFGTGAVNF